MLQQYYSILPFCYKKGEIIDFMGLTYYDV